LTLRNPWYRKLDMTNNTNPVMEAALGRYDSRFVEEGVHYTVRSLVAIRDDDEMMPNADGSLIWIKVPGGCEWGFPAALVAYVRETNPGLGY
jgi:hypothetical protein